jgi:hypothetical protein
MSIVNPQDSTHFESQETEVKTGKRSSLSDGLMYVKELDSEDSNKKRRKTTELSSKSKLAVENLPFIILLVIFIVTSSLIAINLREGIAPDEAAHFAFAKYFSTTFGLPKDTPETVAIGWQIQHNPFLYHWITGRVIQILRIVRPMAGDRSLLVVLRLLSSLMSAGSLIFLFLTSKLLIKNKWLQLMPVFLLINTLMFVFLSGAVSYDNLANLFSFAAIYFFTCAFRGKNFTRNSILMIISVGLACLVKYSALPLAFGLVSWWIYLALCRKNEKLILKIGKRHVILILIALAVVVTNIALYGYNLIAYRSVTPTCEQVIEENLCQTSVFAKRYQEFALPEKLSIRESIEEGYLDPVEYVFYSWIPNILYRIYGILAHLSYFPRHIIVLFYILYLSYLVLGVRVLPKKPGIIFVAFVTLFLLYGIVLLRINYNAELIYGFKQIGMHGRYLFPVLGIFYILISKILEKGRKIKFNWLLGFSTLALFLYSGPLSLIIHYSAIFKDWF